MGKVRTELIKRIARALVEQYPNDFTADFESNKKRVESLTDISSTKMRNRVAGYTTRLMASIQEVQSDSEELERGNSSDISDE